MMEILQLYTYKVIFEVNIGDSHIYSFLKIHLGDTLAKRCSSRRELFEFHHILGESTSFIRKDIMNCAKFFIQVRRLGFCSHIFVNIIYRCIILDVDSLEKFNSF